MCGRLPGSDRGHPYRALRIAVPPLHVEIGDGYGEGVSKRLLGVGKADLVVGEVGLSIDRIELDVQLAQYA